MHDSSKAGPALYSIAAVSKLTGVGCHALRVWERRYGFPVPVRTPSGHRRYEAAQVEILGELSRRHDAGESLAELMNEARTKSPTSPESNEIPKVPDQSSWSVILDHILNGNLESAQSAYLRAIEGLDVIQQVFRVIQPCLVEIGERWFRGECDVFQEHAASLFLRQKLSYLLEDARAANRSPRRVAVIGTVQGDRHEGGVMMLGLMLELAGWRTHSLGVDLPVEEYQKAIDLWKPDAVCLSLVLSRNINKRFDELSKLHGAPIYVGGRSILNYGNLARRHGLRPQVGPCEVAVPRMIAELEGPPRKRKGR